MSWTNCLVIVPQDKFYAVEKFGRYEKMLPPGLSYTGFDICGCCIGLRSITSRVTQLNIDVKTKTSDHVFVSVRLAVQNSVLPSSVVDAMYKLSDVHAQVEAYVSDVVRSEVPQMTLQDLYEKKDHLSDSVLRQLHAEMREYGFAIHRTLVTDIAPDPGVVEAMNEINRQRYHWQSATLQAEACQIRLVRSAQAEADAMALKGEGLARQRGAIIAGLREAVEQGFVDRKLSHDQISNLLVITQYFEILREVAERCEDQLVFVPHSPDAVSEILRQVVEAVGKEQRTVDAPPQPEVMRDARPTSASGGTHLAPPGGTAGAAAAAAGEGR